MASCTRLKRAYSAAWTKTAARSGDERLSQPLVRRLPPGATVPLVGGLVLVALAAFVPARGWINLLLTVPPPALESELQLGAGIFRLSLLLLGAFLLLGASLGWLSRASLPENAPASSTDSRHRRLHALDLAVLLMVALFLRLIHLESDLWIDELLTLVQQGEASFGEIVAIYRSQNQHFLYSLLARASLALFGESAIALRLPAVLFGVAGVGALYALANHVSGRLDAILSAVLLTVSYHHIWFSQNARGYTAVLFWALLATWIFLRARERSEPRTWMGYGMICALGAYSHQTMVFVVLAHFLIWAWRAVREHGETTRERWLPLYQGFLLFGLLTFALHAIALPQIFGPAMEDLSAVADWKSLTWTVRETARGLQAGSGGVVGLAAAGAVLAAGCVSFWRRCSALVATLFLSTLIGALVVAGTGHPLWPRFFFFGAGFGVLILVRGALATGGALGRLLGAGTRARRTAGVVIASLMILVAATSIRWVYHPKQDFTGARDFVKRQIAPGGTVVAVGLAAYAYSQLYAQDWSSAETRDELDRIRGTAPETWVLYTMPLYMEAYHPELLDALASDFDLVRTFPGTLNGGTVFVYRSRLAETVGLDLLDRQEQPAPVSATHN